MSSLLQSKKVKYGPMGPGGNSREEVLPGLLPCCFLRVCAGPPCTRTSWDWVSRSLCSWVQSLVRGGLVNQAPNHPARGRTAEAVGWLWIHWFLISCVWCKLIFSSSGFFTDQAPGRGIPLPIPLGFTSSYTHWGSQVILRQEWCRPVDRDLCCRLPFLCVNRKQQHPGLVLSLSKGPGLLLFSLMLVLSVSFNSISRVFSYLNHFFCPYLALSGKAVQKLQLSSTECELQLALYHCKMPVFIKHACFAKIRKWDRCYCV